ncbi:MAG TPA: tRNA (adenosine(37)-N6)-threonylcarbamoyltransferase complex transferase subunit TsaD [Thermoanaerobaculia bacterium]|nr:tRNA (adenosine(37)-N6)-threonylcarbamoyltransferase complex transferase subunit TsaD [Thermoanaerobaculia bacterium]
MDVVRPLVLAIETSCDDTACALLDGDGRVLASSVSSQLLAHRPYGGVVPEIASREHLANWPTVAAATLAPLGIAPGDADLVAATRGPGLVGALLVGLSLGKALAYALGRPFYGVHHLEGHLWSPFLAGAGEPAATPPARFVALVVSGGHTALYAVADGAVGTLAETRDDAMGEVFDKLGKRLGLPYPQGPVVDRLAEGGDAAGEPLPVPRVEDDLYFSFSGLKSAAIRRLEQLERAGAAGAPGEPSPAMLDLLAGFRAAAVAQLVDRLERLYQRQPFALLAVSGGVAANRLLRPALADWASARGVDLRLVPPVYAGDNAAMIALAALQRHRRGDPPDPWTVEAESRIPFGAAAAKAPAAGRPGRRTSSTRRR